MKRSLDEESTAAQQQQQHQQQQQRPSKSKRMGSNIVCPKEEDIVEESTMNDQVEQMDAVATGEGM